MLPEDMVKSVVQMVSGIRAKYYVAGIAQHHRIQATEGLINALEYVKNEIDRIGHGSAIMHEYKADGKGSIGLWENLMGWYPIRGTLRIIEPEEALVCDFSAEPISLAAFSTTTDSEAEVVFIGKGMKPEDYEGKDVKGKVVLTTSRASKVHKIACIEHGAIGLLTYIPPSGKDEIAAMRRYEGIWPKQGEEGKTKFGFALTQADGIRIKNWLDEGKTIRVKAEIKAELKPGTQGVLSAVIPGKETDKEVWLTSHICHPNPGANDNASGSGALLETYRTIASLLNEGKIELPEYSIRFIWMGEWYGMIHYIDSNKDLLSKCKFMINADMVGADPAKAGSILTLYRTPYSLPSSLNDVVGYWLQAEADRKPNPSLGEAPTPHPWNLHHYGAGSDHFMFTDSTIGIPGIMLNQSIDNFYHTSSDTIDKIDESQMAWASRVIVLSVLSLAHPRFVCKEKLLTLIRNEGTKIMQRVSVDAVNILGRCLENPEKVYPRTMRWLGYAKDIACDTLDKTGDEWHLISEQKELRDALKASIEMAYATEMVVARKAYLGACAEVGLEAKEEEHFDLDSFESEIEVKRKLEYAMPPGHLGDMSTELAIKYSELYEKDKKIFYYIDELLNMSTDWISLDEIHDRLCFQFGKFSLSTLEDITEDLKQADVIETRKG